uniref:Uncharacterized protein LOC100368746 n=1 Tax=Saccoglossus kowalevskii TaxID=10224 RepID=A0ABM0ML27_SACKO|nr:PREDICTED: uncharacterized protein LOC100368746 [Saccoglossus kowalevskii]
MKDCDNTISVALQAPQIGGRPADEYNTLFHKEKETLDSIFGITMPGPETIPKSKEHTLQMIADSENVPCVGLYFPLDFASLINSDVLLLEVEKGLARPPPMKEMADVVMGNICESGPFATVHWRNKSGEICTAGARSGSIDPATCTKKINYLAKAANLLPEAIMHAVNEYNIQCLYIAHPPYARKIDELLKGKLPRVFSRSDILANVDLANGPFSQIKDEYYMSLLEQEMCARSDVFLSCRKSAWSRVVRNEREAHGRISIFLADLPGIPPEFTNLI